MNRLLGRRFTWNVKTYFLCKIKRRFRKYYKFSLGLLGWRDGKYCKKKKWIIQSFYCRNQELYCLSVCCGTFCRPVAQIYCSAPASGQAKGSFYGTRYIFHQHSNGKSLLQEIYHPFIIWYDLITRKVERDIKWIIQSFYCRNQELYCLSVCCGTFCRPVAQVYCSAPASGQAEGSFYGTRYIHIPSTFQW